MRYYKTKNIMFYEIIRNNKITACINRVDPVYNDVMFFKNGLRHNAKNYAIIRFKEDALSPSLFCLHDKEIKINSLKEWRKYVKLLVFT